MECLYEDSADGVRVIRLAGRMDLEGNEQIALRFNTLTAGAGPAVIVDLSSVDFLSSLGIGTILTGAKNVTLRKGVVVLCGAKQHVMSALERTHVTTMIPMCATLDEARVRATTPAES
jgi:anti-anti-sigma factor